MDWHYGFTMAVRYFDNNITEMSKRTGIDMDRLNYLRNGAAKKIGLEEALIIQVETGGAVSWRQLVTDPDPRIQSLRLAHQPISFVERLASESGYSDKKDKKEEKPFSQKVFEAMEYEKQHCSHRQGQRTDRQLRENFHEVKGRTDIYLVKKFHLGCAREYRWGKTVMQNGVFALIQAMDDWLPVYLAATLADLSRKEQQGLFQEKNREEILTVARASRKQKQQKKQSSPGRNGQLTPHEAEVLSV